MAIPNLYSDIVNAAPPEEKPQGNMYSDIIDPNTLGSDRRKKEEEEKADQYKTLHSLEFAKDAARTALQGATFGWGDEIIGKVRSKIEGRPYEEVREEEREALRRFKRQTGPAAGAMEIAGGIAVPLGPLAKVFQGSSTIGSMAKAVPLGYGVGAVSGAGSSESDKPGAMRTAAHEGGVMGSMIAPVIPLAGRVIGGSLRRSEDAMQQLMDHEAAARLYLADKLRAAGMTEKQIAAELARGQAATKFVGGDAVLPETIADVTPATQRTLRGIKVGGDADDVIEPFLAQRQAGTIDFAKGAETVGQHGRLTEDLRLSLKLSAKELADKLSTLTGKRSAEADKLFGAARAQSEPFELSRTLETYNLRAMDMPDPAQRAILERAVRFFDQAGTAGAGRGGSFPVDNVKRFHEAKGALDDLINRAEVKEQGNLRRYLTQLKHDLMDAVFLPDAKGAPTINKAYRDALDKYASRSELLNAAELGAGFARGTEQVTDKMFRALSEGEKAMFRAAWQHVTTRGMGGKAAGPTTDFTQELRKENTIRELRTILPPGAGKSAEFPGGNREKLAELVKREARMSDTARKVLGNSSTAEKAVDAIDIGRVARVMRYVKDSGGMFQAAAGSLSNALERFASIKGPRAQYVARKMLSTDPAEQQAFLREVEKTYGSNVARRLTDIFHRWLLQFEASIGGAAARSSEEQKEQERR
jgi:hypothetical protein